LRTYLVSHSISPADIVFFFNFRVVKEYLFYFIYSSFDKETKNLTNLKRWMANL